MKVSPTGGNLEGKTMKWNAELYDNKHSFVFEYGENVLELLDVKRRERVLDLGCGTGHLTQRIHDAWRNSYRH